MHDSADTAPVDTLRRALAQSPSFDAFGRLRDHFSRLLRSGLVENALRQDLERLAGQRSEEAMRTLLFEDAAGQLHLSVCYTDEPVTIDGSASHQFVGVVAGQARVKCYAHAQRLDPSVFDPECRLERRPDVVLAAGDVLLTEAWTDVIEPYGSGLLLWLRSAAIHHVQWIYDRQGMPLALMPASRALARIQASLELLGHVGDADDASLCFRLAAHGAHAIRWQAIRTACQLHHPDSVTLLQRALHDSHPEIRDAASQTLRQWT
jgi:HEAT repeats